MYDTPKNCIEFRLWGRYALFTDPLTRVGGEKCSYQIPTYEALKGVCKSIYWKPTIIWIVDSVRVMRRIRTQTKGVKPLKFSGGNDLSIYTFLTGEKKDDQGKVTGKGVEYQIRAHFEMNANHVELENDRIDGKHFAIVKRMLERGGRQDIFLGTRDCQGYVEPCTFGEGEGAYDDDGEISFGVMFHGFDYPDETGKDELAARFWRAVMRNGRIDFPRPDAQEGIIYKHVRPMTAKSFDIGKNVNPVRTEEEQLGVME